MTCREKLAKEHPMEVDPKYDGGCYGCPHDYGYLHKPDECMDDGSSCCDACWNREIPETEEIKKEKDIMPINAVNPDARKMTKAELIEEIKYAHEHIQQMQAQIKNLERYKQYEDMADEMKAMHTAFMNSGFSDEQAFEIIKMLTQAVVPTALRGMGL